ncbi:hypothetical protein Sta7437_4858 (plasmid) [Stanieria cyanosphaera PCC 7437]|uniref:Uncharacterized protein n=1 Tax=Stanieria cyanosphaera (strain ATCC 29371 / PCC 7437) TaxID=111780 RepID=K9Y1T2_STAC7|nr:hypothetical protein [Stanieria cyanosphaera]AFZ38289.1 hypothetical protein Sta7437_4858 [Stanieria cyanosphaera PCC 7437]
MNSLKKILQLSKFLAVALVFSLFLFSQNAIAKNITGMSAIEEMFEADIQGGNFTVDAKDLDFKNNLRVGSAVLSLPPDETGTIEEIAITGPSGKIFGCVNIKVQNGTDLIKSCGGPAYLVPGKTKYYAKGSNFQPQTDLKLRVKLSE